MNLALEQNEVHIWFARQPSICISDLDAYLSRDELDHTGRLRFEQNRFAYKFAHGVLRDILSMYLRHSPSEIRFDKNNFGKPFLDSITMDSRLQFNLSHADHMVVVGIRAGQNIGVDVENVRPIDDIPAIAQSYFSRRERDYISAQESADQLRAFFSCWTRKEAYIKAVGKGLSIPLNSFEIAANSHREERFGVSGLFAADQTSWQIADLNLPQGYVGAIAVDTRIDRLTQFEWQFNFAPKQHNAKHPVKTLRQSIRSRQ